MLPRRHRSTAFAVLLSLLPFISSCAESSPADPEIVTPWQTQLLFGNTSINSGPITTNQDVASGDRLVDFVSASALPNVDMELFVTHVFVPVASAMTTQIANVVISARRSDGTNTGNFFRSTEFVQQSRLNGQLYDVHRLQGLFLGSPALRPQTFGSVSFAFTVEHVSASGAVLNRGQKSIEIQKR